LTTIPIIGIKPENKAKIVMTIYLASQSPRRAQLLKQIGVQFELLLPTAEEDPEQLEATIQGESPVQYVERVTRAKADAAVARMQLQKRNVLPILVSDTTVAIGGTIFGKPENAESAKQILTQLSGKTHKVLTAVAIAQLGSNQQHSVRLALSRSRIQFRRLKASEIDQYIATQEPFGKAGAYAIQGYAATFIAHIEGSYSGIMGLPLFETAKLLKLASAISK
jgi:septum formation protein